jgi:hypothetical protein
LRENDMHVIKRKRFSHRLGVFALAVLLALSATLALQAGADTSIVAGDFTIAAADGNIQIDTDYTYANNVLTITSAKAMTISMASSVETTTAGKIVINSTAPANITIENVKIDVSGTEDACAFDVGTSNLNLTLSGSNVLKSNGVSAGLQVQEHASITITSIDGDGKETGTLQAFGGQGSATPSDANDQSGARGAGIGAPMATNAGTITINGGTIEAYGGYDSDGSGAGIGGGGARQDTDKTGGNGGVITINGGVVRALNSPNTNITNENGGAAIGGGGGHNELTGNSGSFTGGHGGIITINGGTVDAYANEYAAAIGSACFIAGGTYTEGVVALGENSQQITITGGKVTATSALGGAGIGGGGYTNGGIITITGGDITAKTAAAAAAIGGGFLGNGGVITITGGLIYATTTPTSPDVALGAGIGGGTGGAAGTIKKSGGIIKSAGGTPHI